MLEQARYVQNSFSVVFPEYRSVSAHEQAIFSAFRGLYFPAKVLPSSAESGEGHRLLFQSQHGHSQIVASDSNVTLNVAYSPDWQTEPTQARGYMAERTQLLFGILETIGAEPPLFCGSVTRVQIPSTKTDEEVANFVAQTFAGGNQAENYHDVTVRTALVVDDLFFSNVTVQNYRTWSVSLPSTHLYRLSRSAAAERGLEIISDFNSRYAFNEDRLFDVTRESAVAMIDRNFQTVQETINRAREAVDERQS